LIILKTVTTPTPLVKWDDKENKEAGEKETRGMDWISPNRNVRLKTEVKTWL